MQVNIISIIYYYVTTLVDVLLCNYARARDWQARYPINFEAGPNNFIHSFTSVHFCAHQRRL